MGEGVEVAAAGFGDEVGLTEPERLGAIVRLRDRYATDEISLDEFSQALDGVLASQTRQELSRISPSHELRAPASRVSWVGAEVLQRHMAPDEQILWVGRPETNLNLNRGNIIAILTVIPFAVVWMSGAIGSGAPVWFPLAGAGVFGTILYQSFGRLFLQARRTLYAVTTRRIVRVVRRSSGEQMDSKLLRVIPTITVTEGKNDRGTVTFGDPPPPPLSRRTRGFDSQVPADPISFVNIAQPTSVARLIDGLQAYEDAHQ